MQVSVSLEQWESMFSVKASACIKHLVLIHGHFLKISPFLIGQTNLCLASVQLISFLNIIHGSILCRIKALKKQIVYAP